MDTFIGFSACKWYVNTPIFGYSIGLNFKQCSARISLQLPVDNEHIIIKTDSLSSVVSTYP